ncbi:unnamed protein product, partial [Didymodactylos carnosus]
MVLIQDTLIAVDVRRKYRHRDVNELKIWWLKAVKGQPTTTQIASLQNAKLDTLESYIRQKPLQSKEFTLLVDCDIMKESDDYLAFLQVVRRVLIIRCDMFHQSMSLDDELLRQYPIIARRSERQRRTTVDHYPNDNNKSEQKMLLERYFKNIKTMHNGPLTGYALILDAATFGTTSMLLSGQHFKPNKIFIPNSFDYEKLVKKCLSKEGVQERYNELHIINITSFAFIFNFKIRAGHLFRFVYLDYTSTWSGARTGKKRCVPEEEVEHLFATKRFYNNSLLAVTLVRRDRRYTDYTMIPIAEAAICQAAGRNGYSVIHMNDKSPEYTSDSRSNMV